jgi:hypothetical protein
MTFNKFLLEKCYATYGNFYKDRDEFELHYASGEVKMDVPNILKIYDEWATNQPKLPSRFKHGDIVSVNVKGFMIDKAEVLKVHFTESKVFYDLGIEFDYSEPNLPKGYTRIYNVDSAFLVPKII